MPASKAPAIPGGRRFAAMLKAIWYLSANDNPYADWLLIRVYQSLAGIRSQMGQVIEAREAEFERLRRKGLALSVLASRSPVTVELGFRSPYGYATAEAIVEFDYHVRMVKTLVLKDRMSDEAGRADIRAVGRGLRALFLEPIRWERHLLREEMLPLSRRDFLPGADEAARQRVRAAVALFGEVPRKVFTGEEAPRHSQRRDHADRGGAAADAAGLAQRGREPPPPAALGTAAVTSAPCQPVRHPTAQECRMLRVLVHDALAAALLHGFERLSFRGYCIEATRLCGRGGWASVETHARWRRRRRAAGSRPHCSCIPIGPGISMPHRSSRAPAIAARRAESLAGCVSPVDARYASPETGQIS
jgi:integrating conjugative element protein (TIGR03761 family)